MFNDMAKYQVTEDFKILFYRAFTKDLPISLAPAEMVFALDTATPVIGTDPNFGNPIYDRTVFPYTNVEILTEKSDDAFTKLHSARMQESCHHDYYDARLEPSTLVWTNVYTLENEQLSAFTLPITGGLTSRVEYAAFATDTGEPVQMGNLTVSKRIMDTTISVTDDSLRNRDLTLISPDDVSPNDVFYRMSLRFIVNPQDSTTAIMQYRNYTFVPCVMSFKTSTTVGAVSQNNFGRISSLIVPLSNSTVGYTTGYGHISSQINIVSLALGAYVAKGSISSPIVPRGMVTGQIGYFGSISSHVVISSSAQAIL